MGYKKSTTKSYEVYNKHIKKKTQAARSFTDVVCEEKEILKLLHLLH